MRLVQRREGKERRLMKRMSVIPEPQSVTYQPGCLTLTGDTAVKKASVKKVSDSGIAQEGYRMKISEDGIVIEASDEAGFFYGEKTLEQIRLQCGETLPCMEINDRPKYPYRSFHLDCVRHFIPVEELKKNIACAAAFKLNQFHWHFSDDQGYRIESEVFPLLTAVGARRKEGNFGGKEGDEAESRYYTKQEVRDVIAFAKEHFVEIVPEIDMPGHVTAILAAYPQLSCRGEKLEVAAKEGIFSDILCAGKEETYAFMEKLLEELTGLFPGKYFHIGGDETPKTRWRECPFCREKMAEEGLRDEKELQGYLQNRIAAFLKKKGKRVIAWNEAALGDNLDPDIILQLWNDDPNDPAMKAFKMKDENGRFTSPNQGIGAKHIRKGGKVISSNMLHSYCDYPYAFVKSKAIFEATMIPQKCGDIPDVGESVLGGEALCWTEHIRSMERLEYQIWPRYGIKADNLWSCSEENTFQKFLRKEDLLEKIFEQYQIKAAPRREYVPNVLTAGRQMLEFVKLLGKDNRGQYEEAHKQV